VWCFLVSLHHPVRCFGSVFNQLDCLSLIIGQSRVFLIYRHTARNGCLLLLVYPPTCFWLGYFIHLAAFLIHFDAPFGSVFNQLVGCSLIISQCKLYNYQLLIIRFWLSVSCSFHFSLVSCFGYFIHFGSSCYSLSTKIGNYGSEKKIRFYLGLKQKSKK